MNFCVAPFVHMFVKSDEDECVCCMSVDGKPADENTELDLRERWNNSKYLRKIRTQFLNDERPAGCYKCFALEDAGGESDRNRFNKHYEQEDLRYDIITGTQYNSPIDLDIRPGNLCNLGCRMCGPGSSSMLQKEARRGIASEVFGDGDVMITDALRRPENIEFLLENIHKSKRIKFLGGEPTIMPEVDRILDILIERELTDVPLHFTTNCTNNNQRFIDKISKFSQVGFNYSVDGTGNTVEYIRHPVKFDTINKNIKVYDTLAFHSQISYTLQAYNLFTFKEQLKWSSEIGIYTRPELLVHPYELSCLSIPKIIRDRVISDILDFIKTYDFGEKLEQKEARKKVEPVLKRLWNDERELPVVELARHTKILDISRNQHIKDYIPEVWEIIKEDYNAIQI